MLAIFFFLRRIKNYLYSERENNSDNKLAKTGAKVITRSISLARVCNKGC